MHPDSSQNTSNLGQESNPDSDIQSQPDRASPYQKFKHRLERDRWSPEVIFFALAVFVYLLTHLVGLTSFPIYFFSDEAIQTVAAANLVRDDFRDEEGTLLPTYFKNGPYFNLSTSVYFQVLPYILFGRSVFATRATSVLISLLAAVSVSLMLRNIFKIRYWWTGVLLLSIAPAWFLHSRTAFETVIFVSFYGFFIYTYLLYRTRSPHYLYYLLVLAALAFYTYSPGQVVVVLTGFLLLISDARYHWQNRRVLLRGSALGMLLILPYLRFQVSHPDVPFEHLRTLGSYWLQPLPLAEKLTRFGSEYLYGLSPVYWFIPNERDLPRHLMKGYGHIMLVFLPFAILGIFKVIKNVRNPIYRILLISLIAAPVGGALVEIGITRVLAFLIPAVTIITLGIELVMTWLEGKRLSHLALAASLFGVLTITNLFILRDVLVNAPTWHQDYGMGGMQYGAQQVFSMAEQYLEKSPETEIILSPNWANGTDTVARFFLGDPLPIQIGSVDGHISHLKPLDQDTLFVMMPAEFQLAQECGKFREFQVVETLPYPTGEDGFYFVRMKYVDNIQEIMEQERQERMALRTADVQIDGQNVVVKHSLLDMGEAEQIFDGDPYTLGRTFEANPAILQLEFPSPRSFQGLSVIIGSTEVEIKALLQADLHADAVEFSGTFQGSIEQPQIEFNFDQVIQAQIMRLEIRDLHQVEPGNVHIWEIQLIPG